MRTFNCSMLILRGWSHRPYAQRRAQERCVEQRSQLDQTVYEGASMSSIRGFMRRFHLVALIAILMSAAACSLPPASTTRTSPTVTPSAKVGQHRITVRPVGSQAAFYELSTGRTYTPR